MHKSLTVRTNTILLALYGAILAACVSASGASKYLLVLVPFAFAGLVAGACQTHAIKANLQAFVSLHSWNEVRNQLLRTRAGQASIALLWLCGASLLSAMLFSKAIPNPAIAVGAYSAFGVMREVAARAGIKTLASNAQYS